ncbi:MAG TPA: glycosyl hydrolase family 28-related protein [Candidatus Saccharimonadales bacterium]
MTRLPTPGADEGNWGNILNDFLSVEHNGDGSLKRGSTIDAAIRQVNGKTGASISLSASDVGAVRKGDLVLHVKDYGAVGDGIANDAAAIQSAIDAAYAAGGGIVLLPQGVYKCQTGLRLKSRVQITGIGVGTRIQAGASLADHLIQLDTASTELTAIENMWLACDAQQAGYDVIYYYNFGGSFTFTDPWHRLRNLIVTKGARNNIFIDAGVRESFLSNILSKNARGGSGLQVNCTDSKFESVICSGSPDGFPQIQVRSGANRFVNCKSFYAGSAATSSDGFRVDYGYNTFVGCEAQDNGRHGFYIQDGSDYITISGFRASGNYESGIQIGAAEGIVIEGFNLQNNVGGGRYNTRHGLIWSGAAINSYVTGSARGNLSHIQGSPGAGTEQRVVTPGGMSLVTLHSLSAQPSDHSLLAWAYDPALANSGSQVGSGTLAVVKVPVSQATTISNIVLYVTTAGSGLTTGQCFAGLYNSAGTLLSSTADQSTAWQSTGSKAMALAVPQAVSADFVYVCFYATGTTMPTFARSTGNAIDNVNLSASQSRFASANTGLTTQLPGTLGALTASALSWWVGLS